MYFSNDLKPTIWMFHVKQSPKRSDKMIMPKQSQAQKKKHAQR